MNHFFAKFCDWLTCSFLFCDGVHQEKTRGKMAASAPCTMSRRPIPLPPHEPTPAPLEATPPPPPTLAAAAAAAAVDEVDAADHRSGA